MVVILWLYCQLQYRFDKMKDEEIRNYNPYGRGGGGAPMKDKEGNVLGMYL